QTRKSRKCDCSNPCCLPICVPQNRLLQIQIHPAIPFKERRSHLPNDTFAIFGARMHCELCAITPKSVEQAGVIAPFHARNALELLDTTTNAEKDWRSAGLRHGGPA